METQQLEAAAMGMPAPPSFVDPLRSRILLIVNDSMLHLNLSSRLRLAGFEVMVTSNGDHAKQKMHSFNPHAVVLDLMVDDDAGDTVIKDIRRDPGAAKLPVFAFASSANSRAAKKAMKAGATRLFTETATPLDDLVVELGNEFAGRRGEEDTAWIRATDHTRAPQSVENRAAVLEAVGRVASHLDVLRQARGNQGRAAVFGELRGKVQPLLALVRGSSHPGVSRLVSALFALLKVLHEMPECATESTQRTVCAAIEVLVRLTAADPAELDAGPLELTAVVADNDMVSRSVVCSALRSVGFKFECFAHASVVLRYFDSNQADLVIVHLAPDASTDPEFSKKLRAKSRNAHTPVILVNGVSDFESRAALKGETSDEVITKPFIFMELSVKALSLALKKHLARNEPAAAAGSAPGAGSAGNQGAEVSFADDSIELASMDSDMISSEPGVVQPPKLPNSRLKGSSISAPAGAGASNELAALRAELAKKQEEREKLVSRIFNNELELDQIRTALDEEREHRQQLEQMVQDLMVGQAPQVGPPNGAADEGGESVGATPLPAELLASLQTQLQELTSEAETLRAALETKQQERQELTARIFKDEVELESIRAQLEQERTRREQLEAGQAHGNRAAGGDDGKLQVEVMSLRQAQEELIRQLTAAKVESEAEFKNKAELEVRLQELTDELKLTAEVRKQLEGERARLDAELQAKVAEVSAATADRVSAQHEQAHANEQLQRELEALRSQYAELESRLAVEQQTANEGVQLKVSLEQQLAAAQRSLAQALAEQQRLADERTELAGALDEQLARLKQEAAEAESARQAEAGRKVQLQKELEELWKSQEELDAQLTDEKKASAEAQARQKALEDHWRSASEQLEQSHAALTQAEQLARGEAERRTALEAQLASLRSELDGKLSSQAQLAAAAGEQKADLERRLLKLEEELPLARQKIAELTTERERVQSELTEQLKAATQAASAAEERSRAEVARSQQLEAELASLRKTSQELGSRLQAEQQRAEAADVARGRLEQQFASARAELEKSLAAQQGLVESHKQVEAELAQQLERARQCASEADTKVQAEIARGQQLSAQLTQLQQGQRELEGRLTVESKRNQEALKAKTGLEKNLERTSVALEKARAVQQVLVSEKQEAEARLNAQLEAASTEASRAKSELAATAGQNQDLTAQLGRLREAHEGLQAQLGQEQSAFAEAKARGDRLETRLAETQVICEELKATLAAERTASAQLAEEKAALESQLAADLKSWTTARGDFEAQLANYKRRETDLSKVLSAAEATAAQAETAHRRELERANKFEQEVTQLWQVRDDLKARVAGSQKQVEELSQQRAALSGRLEETNQHLEAVRTEASQAKAASARNEEQNRELTAQNESLRTDAAVMADRQRTHEQELVSMERRVRDSVASLARTTAELETERGDRRRIEQRAAGLAVQLQDLHRELNSHLEIEKENQARIAEVEQELTTRVKELATAQSAFELERGQRREADQRTASLATQIESLRQEITDRLRLDKETQARIANLEQQLRAREESLVRVTQHLETEREERRRVELRGEGLIAQTQQLQDQLEQAGQREKENLGRIVQLEEQGQARSQELDQLQSGLASERGERRKVEERAQSLSVQLRELHRELDLHLRLEKEFQGKVAELEVQLSDRQQVLARVQSELEKESADRELAEQQMRAGGDISAKLQQYQASFEEARRAFDQTQQELESRLRAAAETAREREELLEREAGEKNRLQKELEVSRREFQAQTQQIAIERSKLQASLQVESMERRRLEGDAMHSRYASLQSSRSGRALVNGFRRQLEKPVDQLMNQARRMLAMEIDGDLKQIAESLMESAVSLQNSVRECDVVDLAASELPVPAPQIAGTKTDGQPAVENAAS